MKKLPKRIPCLFYHVHLSDGSFPSPTAALLVLFACVLVMKRFRSQKLSLLIMRGLVVYDEPAMLAP